MIQGGGIWEGYENRGTCRVEKGRFVMCTTMKSRTWKDTTAGFEGDVATQYGVRGSQSLVGKTNFGD